MGIDLVQLKQNTKGERQEIEWEGEFGARWLKVLDAKIWNFIPEATEGEEHRTA